MAHFSLFFGAKFCKGTFCHFFAMAAAQDGDHSEGQTTITKIEDRLTQIKSHSRDKKG